MPMKQVLIVAPPGPLQEGLQILLATFPEVTVVVVASAGAAQTQVAVQELQLVIIAGKDAARTQATIVDQCSEARLLLLVGHEKQIAAAKAAGADAVMVEGTAAGRLLDVVGRLLAEASADYEEEK